MALPVITSLVAKNTILLLMSLYHIFFADVLICGTNDDGCIMAMQGL